MVGENLTLFRNWIDAYGRWDVDWMLEHVTEDLEWIPRRAATEGSFHGRDGLRAFLRDTQDTFESVSLDYADVRDLGDRVLALGRVRFKGRGSGVETETPSAVIASIENGRVARFEDYGNHQAALAAAGLA